jgi:hypothetical protein
MKELFISPILFDYEYLDELCLRASDILKVDLKDKKLKQEFRLLIFLNFNRYLAVGIGLMSENIKQGFYEDLMELMESHKEKETIDLLTNLDILPEVQEEFLDILKNLK